MVFRLHSVNFKEEFKPAGWDLWCFENACLSVGFRVITAGTWAQLTELAA